MAKSPVEKYAEFVLCQRCWCHYDEIGRCFGETGRGRERNKLALHWKTGEQSPKRHSPNTSWHNWSHHIDTSLMCICKHTRFTDSLTTSKRFQGAEGGNEGRSECLEGKNSWASASGWCDGVDGGCLEHLIHNYHNWTNRITGHFIKRLSKLKSLTIYYFILPHPFEGTQFPHLYFNICSKDVYY